MDKDFSKKYSKIKPTPSDFKSSISHFIYHSAPDTIDENLLILFHGLGDNEMNFSKLGQKMNIPQTACLTIRGTSEIPFFDDGYCWFPSFEISGDLNKGKINEQRRKQGLEYSRKLIIEILDILKDKYLWKPERIFLLGFSQLVLCREVL